MSMPQRNATDAQTDSDRVEEEWLGEEGQGEEGGLDTTTLTGLMDGTVCVSKELLDWAKGVAKNYLLEVMAKEGKMDLKERGNLACYAHCRKETLPVYVEWATFRWTKNKEGKLLPFYKNLKKPARGWSYNINTLMKHAHEDALERVKKTEYKFTAIRKINHHLTRTRFHLRECLKVETVLDGVRLEEGLQVTAGEVESATITSLLEGAVVVSDDLLVWAENVVKDFQTSLRAQEQRIIFKDRSKLTPRTLRKNDNLPVYVEWSSIRWVRNDDGTAKPFFKNIKKPARGFRYTLTTLNKYAHSDSRYIVEEAEGKFAAVRKINHHLSRIRFHLREALKGEAVLDGTTQEITHDEQ